MRVMTPIDEIIRSSGLTQEAIARESGLSLSAIQKIAGGKRPDVRVSTYQSIKSAIDRLLTTCAKQKAA